ncbi:GNAT family N-acetyltransferase [Lutibacter sp. B2]|nr:GNAT family N-acetyltransferase [Lutibacter sp. B2]
MKDLKPRSIKMNEFEDVIDLINEVFRLSNGHKPTMEREFPLLLNKNNIKNMIIIKEDEKTVADVNFMTQDVLVQGSELKVASIGAVCTKKEYEGRRFSSSILDLVDEKMYEDHVDLVLISGNRSLYTRRMCSQVKNFYKYLIKPKEIELDCSIEEYTHVYLNEMIHLYNENSTRFFRTKDNFNTLLESATFPWGTYSYKKLVVKIDNKFIGYIVLRIIDKEIRRGEIIEMELPMEMVHDVISHLASESKLNFIEYWVHIKDIANQLTNYDELSLDYLHGTIKIINFEKLCKNLEAYFITCIDKEFVCNMEFKTMGDEFLIKYKNEELMIKNVHLLNKLFFEGRSENLDLDVSTLPIVEKFVDAVFPIPFVWPANLNYQ